jgi:hypothetical protein
VNCCLCGNPTGVENAHPKPKGMGGRGKKAPPDELATKPLCAGAGGNNDPTSCHGAHHAGHLNLRVTDGVLEYRRALTLPWRVAFALTSRGLILDGKWHPQRYADDFDPDTVDGPMGVCL